MLDRAYSTLTVKAVNDERREIEGIASTPSVDRMDDIVEPLGAEFDLPLPFLMHHDSRLPVGHVVRAKATKGGITVLIRLQQTDEPGPVKDRLDTAWQEIKLGLVRGLSIGFKPIESVDIEGSWGRRFTRWQWLELSGVTVPANQDATITAIKSLDAQQRAASGKSLLGEQHPPASGNGSGRGARASVQFNHTKPRGGKMKSITEQIAALEATRAAKFQRMEEIQSKAASEGRTKDASEREEFDTLKGDVEGLEVELKDLRDMAALAEKAAPVPATPPAPGQVPTEVRHTPSIRVTDRIEPGVRFARAVKAMGVAARKNRDPEVVARQMYPDDHLVHKAAIQAGSTVSGGSNWGSALVGDETSVFADFVEFLRPQTILGKFGSNGIPALRRVPFRTPLISQTAGGDGYWVGEGKAKPLTKFAFSRTTMDELKVANIAVVTDELLRQSSPSADMLVRDSLAAALRERLDIDFVDPAKTANPGESPASITQGVSGTPSSGTDADAVRVDVAAAMAGFIAADNPPTTGVWIMSATRALALSLMHNALGQREFPDISIGGGRFAGLPVIVSEYLAGDEYGDNVYLVNASDIYLADEGGIQIDVSREASLEMEDDYALAQDAKAGTGTSLVSLWQTNAVGFRCERVINWAKRRASAVQVLTGVLWGPTAS